MIVNMSEKDNKVFEDEFMDIQSGLISLCLEVAGNKADKIFAHCSIEKKSLAFNAFVEADGEFKTLNQLDIDKSRIMNFLRTGTMDLQKMKEVCAKYDKPTPTEIKMYYDINTNKFNAEYQYKPLCMKQSAGENFMDWLNETKNKS